MLLLICVFKCFVHWNDNLLLTDTLTLFQLRGRGILRPPPIPHINLSPLNLIMFPRACNVEDPVGTVLSSGHFFGHYPIILYKIERKKNHNFRIKETEIV